MATRTTRDGKPVSTSTRTTRSGSTASTAGSAANNFGFGAGLSSALYGKLAATSSSGSSSGGSSSGSSSSSGGGSYRASSSGGGGGGGGGAVSSSSWGCPSGATLVREPGTSNLVCRWNHNGAYFAAQPKGGGSAGGGTGGGGSTTTPPSTVVDSPEQTGQWLQAAGDIFASDPQAMLAVQLQDQYGDTGGNALYGMLTPYADAANALFLAQTGMDGTGADVDSHLGWLDDYWTALRTPGARIDTTAAMNNIFGAAADSPLMAYLTTGDPSQQANRALNLIAGATDVGMNRPFANAIMDRLRLERDRYLGEAARGGTAGSYIDFLKSSGLDLNALMGRSS